MVSYFIDKLKDITIKWIKQIILVFPHKSPEIVAWIGSALQFSVLSHRTDRKGNIFHPQLTAELLVH